MVECAYCTRGKRFHTLPGAGRPRRADLVGYWKLDGDATDSSPNGLDGTLEGDFQFANDVPPLLGKGMSILLNPAGVMDPGYIDLGNPDILNFGENDWTITAWMKVPELLSERGNIFSNGGDNAGGVRYVLAYQETNVANTIVLTTDDNSTKLQAISDDFDFTVNDEQWHHVVGMRAGNELRVYIDGELAGENLSVPRGYDLSETSQQNAVIGIGISQVDGSFEKSFQGWIDDVAAFNEALSEAQIAQVMNGDFTAWGIGGNEPQLQAGDANMDLKFDQLDLVQVQIAAKYLTGQTATWGEGDWNAAPGGSVGNPPQGDGQFNQLDIIAALNAGKYLTGPYAALAGSGYEGRRSDVDRLRRQHGRGGGRCAGRHGLDCRSTSSPPRACSPVPRLRTWAAVSTTTPTTTFSKLLSAAVSARSALAMSLSQVFRRTLSRAI